MVSRNASQNGEEVDVLNEIHLSTMLIAVNYHYIRPSFDSPYPGILGITSSQFERQLKMLGSVGMFVSAEQVQAAIQGIDKLPDRSILVTFDDGLREQYENAWPILRRLGIPAIFFLNTAPIAQTKVSAVHKIHLLRAQLSPGNFLQMLRLQAPNHNIDLELQVESAEARSQYEYDAPEVARLKYLLNFMLTPKDRDQLVEACFNEAFPGQEAEISQELYMDLEQIQALGSYGYIGSHAHEHLPIGLLSTEIAEEQIQLSLIYLEKWTGYRPFAMSYPYGSKEASCPKVAEIAARLGIDFAFTMERAGNDNLFQPLHLARFDSNDLPGGRTSKFKIQELFHSIPSASWY
jgi:peptidoglycan/xylan/chitin deacetylase (PgdA/CDA1 family)